VQSISVNVGSEFDLLNDGGEGPKTEQEDDTLLEAWARERLPIDEFKRVGVRSAPGNC